MQVIVAVLIFFGGGGGGEGSYFQLVKKVARFFLSKHKAQ